MNNKQVPVIELHHLGKEGDCLFRVRSLAKTFLFCLLCYGQSGLAQFCDDCIAIATQKDFYQPSEQVSINLEVTATRMPDGITDADVHVAWIQPNREIEFIHRIPGWKINDMSDETILVESMENREVGQHWFYFVLARIDSDPLDSNSWLAIKGAEIYVLPENWRRSDHGNIFSNNITEMPRLIAHGGGEIAGHRVTNSLQALNRTYRLGQRFIEVDFSWTSDNHLVLIHDWDETYRQFFSKNSEAPDLNKFNRLSMSYGLTQLNFEQLLVWLRERPDALIITDIKERNLEGLAYIAKSAGKMKRQFVPQIYDVNEYNQTVALGFEKIIFTLYRSNISDAEVLDFASNHALAALTLPVNRAIKSTLAQKLQNKGLFVYAHTVNQADFFGYLKSRGVGGVYSDVLFPRK